VWGQIDSVGTLVLLATIYALARGWTEVAAVGAVVALLVKFQFAFLVPVVAIVGIRATCSAARRTRRTTRGATRCASSPRSPPGSPR
jgi:Gpi18-like mannosyltransferase